MAIKKNDYLDGDGNYDLKKDLVDELIDEVNDLDGSALLMRDGTTNDLNLINENGIYVTTQTTLNKPSNATWGGVCVHILRSGQSAVQLHIDISVGKIMSRARAANGVWSSWV